MSPLPFIIARLLLFIHAHEPLLYQDDILQMPQAQIHLVFHRTGFSVELIQRTKDWSNKTKISTPQ